MIGPQEGSYPNEAENIAEVYDVRVPGVAARFELARLAWGEDGSVEVLDVDHPVLIVRPGGAMRLLRGSR
jgi:hypothetical protein